MQFEKFKFNENYFITFNNILNNICKKNKTKKKLINVIKN